MIYTHCVPFTAMLFFMKESSPGFVLLIVRSTILIFSYLKSIFMLSMFQHIEKHVNNSD